jgi:plasmid replication initiation protein
MTDELIPELVNTPETLGVTPRYVLQHNAISRSAQNLSATTKKLTAMAMSLLPSDLSSLTASFTFTQFCKALGYENGGKEYVLFKAAVNECMRCVISLETAPDAKGRKDWKQFTWFTVAEFSEKTGKATMKFSSELADFLKTFKWIYAKISLCDVGCLQSRYGIRIFELVMSYAFLNGRDGYKSGEWYVQENIEDFRKLLGVPEGTYAKNRLFRQKVIEVPVREINKADIGVEIKPEGVKNGRNLAGIRLNCRQKSRTVTVKKRGGKKAQGEKLELPEGNPKLAREHEEKELEYLKERYPAEFATLYAAALEATPKPFSKTDFMSKVAAEGMALGSLRKKYGIVK